MFTKDFESIAFRTDREIVGEPAGLHVLVEVQISMSFDLKPSRKSYVKWSMMPGLLSCVRIKWRELTPFKVPEGRLWPESLSDP